MSVEVASAWRGVLETRRPSENAEGVDRAWGVIFGGLRRGRPSRASLLRRAHRVMSASEALADLLETDWRARVEAAASDLGLDDLRWQEDAAAIVTAGIRRTLGLRLHSEQIAAGLAMHRGAIVEMATGEGKTLAAVIPAVLAGWRRVGCHVVTVNDYLAERDATDLESTYAAFGLCVGHVTSGMTPEERRRAYEADVTYVTHKDLAADFLRDHLHLQRLAGPGVRLESVLLDRLASGRTPPAPLLRGLHCAIVDEADSVLIDDAVTPLILSGSGVATAADEIPNAAAAVARSLRVGGDFAIDMAIKRVELTAGGRRRVEEMQPARTIRREWHEAVLNALHAEHLLERDASYIVEKDRIVIVDESTGRMTPDRTWRGGLHQAVEVKEGVRVTEDRGAEARISFQRFFRMYGRLSGMTGAAAEAAREFRRTYDLPVVVVPTHRPIARRRLADRVFRGEASKFAWVVDEVLRRRGASVQPILIGVRSVSISESLSGMLEAVGVPHRVLNALRHAEEAEVIGSAGEAGRVTIATNMAGRGADIRLDDAAREAGGLLVIATEPHLSRRLDRQLFGRSGRQGDPGEVVLAASLEDEIFRRRLPGWVRGAIPASFGGALIPRLQQRCETAARRGRTRLLREDDWLDLALGFARR